METITAWLAVMLLGFAATLVAECLAHLIESLERL